MWSTSQMLAEWTTLHAPGIPTSATNATFARTLADRAVSRYLPEITSKRDLRILDVGCGDGGFIYMLREIGFTNVLGVDLYIASEIEHDNGVKVRKEALDVIEPSWDVIMLHHAFEHMSDPLQTLQAIVQRLSPNGFCLIRIPIASSYAWQHYGTNWAQLDCPRHFFLHSLQSLERLANTLYDSTGTGLALSELYRQDVSMAEGIPLNQRLSPDEIRAFSEQADQLNRENGVTRQLSAWSEGEHPG